MSDQEQQARGWWHRALSALRTPWGRLAIVLVALAAVALFSHANSDYLSRGWALARDANAPFVCLAIFTAVLSMVAQAELMVVLLRGAGVPVNHARSLHLGFVANSWSASLPGGPAVSAAMIFREQMRWGATAVVASWYLVMSGLLAAAGLALLGLGSVYFIGAKIQPLTLVISLLFLVLVAWAFKWVAQHPDRVCSWAAAVLHRVNRMMGANPARGAQRLRDVARQLQAVDVGVPTLGGGMAWALANWVLEIACLWASLRAVGAEPAIAGVTLSFLMAKLVGQAQVTPGGLGPVDVTLTSTLVPFAEIPASEALAAVILFRMISFVLITIMGWILFLIAWLRPGREGLSVTPTRDEE